MNKYKITFEDGQYMMEYGESNIVAIANAELKTGYKAVKWETVETFQYTDCIYKIMEYDFTDTQAQTLLKLLGENFKH